MDIISTPKGPEGSYDRIRARYYNGESRITPPQPVYYCLVGQNLVLGPFLSIAEAVERRAVILDRDRANWEIRPMWQG